MYWSLFCRVVIYEILISHRSLYRLYPATAPVKNTTAYYDLKQFEPDIPPGLGRSSGQQAAYQATGLVMSIAFAIIGGLITGKYMLTYFLLLFGCCGWIFLALHRRTQLCILNDVFSYFEKTMFESRTASYIYRTSNFEKQ